MYGKPLIHDHGKNYLRYLLSIFLILFVISYSKTVMSAEADEVRLTFLHLNDVYEITPVSGGTQGGIARVATLKKDLLKINPNSYITLSGDIYGPSGLSNAAIVDGKPLGGKHVVASLNKVGVDFFNFGDHEFDQFSAEQVLSRFRETTYLMLSSSYADEIGNPFKQSDGAGGTKDVLKNTIFEASNKAGTATIRVGVFGITEPLRSSDLKVTYTEWQEAATEQVAALKGGDNPVDVLIALTHFKESIDVEIAKKFPEIDLILGGDDHEHVKVDTGTGFAPIYKSDSNARNVYIVDLSYDTASKMLKINDRVQAVTDAIKDDPAVLAEVDKWVDIGFAALKTQGIDAAEIIAQAPYDLDGFSSSIRKRQTKLTSLILESMNDVVNTELSLFTSGFMRLDDLLPKGGDISGYDIVRAFPSDFDISSVRITGATLKSALDGGQAAIGGGGFLLYTDNISRDSNTTWMLNNIAIDDKKVYSVGLINSTAQRYAEFEALVAFDDGSFIKTSDSTMRQAFTAKLKASSPTDSSGGGSFAWYLLPLLLLFRMFKTQLTLKNN